MKIIKDTITITVLRQEDEEFSPIEEYTLSDIADNIDDGPWLGTMRVESSVLVPADKVRDECLAVGNDGTFFDED